jgi:hypothetical protein
MAKKAAKIPDRVYPRDLHGILQRLWDNNPLFRGWPNVELPPKAVFDEIIDVSYHASLLTEEGRPTVFRIVFLDSQSRVSPRDDDELPPVTRYLLKEPVPFTQGELRRLAPVADPRRVLIAVEQSGGRLQIYGLVDIGMALWEMARHERVMGHSSPEALVVMSTRPGELSISRGDRPVLRLRRRDRDPGAKCLAKRASRGVFRCGVRGIHPQCLPAIWHQSKPRRGRRAELRPPVVYRVGALVHSRAGTRRHAVVRAGGDHARGLAPAEPCVDQVRLAQHAPRDALVSAMAARLRHNALAERLQNRRTVKAEELEQLDALAGDQQTCEDAARDAARFIASLTAVDGAVVLTDTLRIIGFGAEVTASFSGGDKVHVAHTAEATETKEVRFAEYGTRHRSAFRFVASLEPSVGFIMSQDGGVKAVRQVGSKLVMWPYFQIGFTTALS